MPPITVRGTRALFCFAMALSCRTFSTRTGPAGAAAVVTRDSAWFEFPAESSAVLTWNTRGTPDMLERGWFVYWDAKALGTDSATSVGVEVRRRSDGALHHGTLGELLRATVAVEASPCWRCEPPGMHAGPVSNVEAVAHGNQVVVTVRGSGAVRHLLWSRPDSVVLKWSGTAERTVPVQYR